MKGHVSRRGKTWAFWFDIDPDPLTGKRRQQTRSGFKLEKQGLEGVPNRNRRLRAGSPRHRLTAQGGCCAG